MPWLCYPMKVMDNSLFSCSTTKICSIHDNLSFRAIFCPSQVTVKFKMEQKTTVSLWVITPPSRVIKGLYSCQERIYIKVINQVCCIPYPIRDSAVSPYYETSTRIQITYILIIDQTTSYTQLIRKCERPVNKNKYQFLALNCLQCLILDSQIFFGQNFSTGNKNMDENTS